MLHKDTLVIVPIYNEGDNLEFVIKDLRKYFDNILVIDDGSIDKSFEILNELGVNFIQHCVNIGQGAAIDSGISYFLNQTNAEFIVTFDGDGQNEAKDADLMIKHAKLLNLSAVLGSRFKNQKYSMNIPFLKKVTLKMATIYEKLFFNIKLTDAHNGLRVINRKLIKDFIYPIKNSDMNHATEISYKICKSRYNFEEFPIKVKYDNKRTQTPFNAINIAFKNIFYKL